ncbi:MAG TPA: helical backbone metal receptor [Candidatus Eremiobacteraceae bacterium]|nr:helical backbone metal receptor [Candidatus Eremiobacteraceae bacterium]
MAVRRALGVFAAAFAVLAAACSSSRNTAAQPAPYDSGIRIVSLAPSITEIAYAVRCGGELIADTTFDDYPPAAKKLPHVADLAHVDLEALATIHPSVVLALHDQEKEGTEIAERLDVPVTYLPNRGMADLYADIAGVGRACKAETFAAELSALIRAQVATIAAKAAHAPTKPRVLFLLGLPGFTAGKSSYLDDLIRMAGGVNVAGNVDQAYPDLSGEAIAAMQPDVIVVGREVPFGQDVRSREPWRSLAAVRSGRIEVSPDDDILERPGPRIVEGLAWLEKAIHQK